MKKKALSLIVYLFLSIPIFSTSLNIKYDVPDQLYDGINKCVGEALNSVLAAHLIVDDDDLDVFDLSVDTLKYDEKENTIRLSFDTNYNDKNLNFNLSVIQAKDKDDIYRILKEKIVYSYKYDILDLFEKSNELRIDYFTPYLASFSFDSDNKPDEAQYYYVRNKADDIVAVANINTLFDENATLNIISNNKLIANLRLTDGPKGLLSTSTSYDFFGKSIFSSISYTYFNSFIPFLLDANLIIEGGGAYQFDKKKSSGFFDIGLSLELPLSVIFDSDSIFKNSQIRATVLCGAALSDAISFNSKYTIGYGIYLSNKYNIEIFYENNTMFTSLINSSFIVGMRFSVLL